MAAGRRIEVDLVREPLLELVGIGERRPDLLGARLEVALAFDVHETSDPQPFGCMYDAQLNGCTLASEEEAP